MMLFMIQNEAETAGQIKKETGEEPATEPAADAAGQTEEETAEKPVPAAAEEVVMPYLYGEDEH